MADAPGKVSPQVPSTRGVSAATRASFQEMKKNLSELDSIDSWELSPNEKIPLAFTEKGKEEQARVFLKAVEAQR